MSGYDEIQTATVIRYPYLWSREAGKGETEGRKDRPVAVGVRIPRAGGDLVLFFPITTKQPERAGSRRRYQQSKSAAPGLMSICAFGSSSMSSTATLSDGRSISNLNRRSVASARHSSCHSSRSSSHAASLLPRSADPDSAVRRRHERHQFWPEYRFTTLQIFCVGRSGFRVLHGLRDCILLLASEK